MTPEIKGKKILVVEDDLDLAKLTHKRLTFAGFDVRVVQDALMGVQESNQFRPDLVVLDLLLPAGGGLAVLKGLKGSVYTAYIPVLVVSGMERIGNPEYFTQMEKLGIEGFLKKPFEGNRLVEEVRRILLEYGPEAPEKETPK